MCLSQIETNHMINGNTQKDLVVDFAHESKREITKVVNFHYLKI
jgi:hypothetical protein